MIYRIDVRTTPPARGGEAALDPVGEAIRHQIAELGLVESGAVESGTGAGAGGDVGPIHARRIFLIDTDAPAEQVRRAAAELLADPVVEEAEVASPSHGDGGSEGGGAGSGAGSSEGDRAGEGGRIEIHLKPGVMDPVAASTEMALRDLGLDVREVRTGRAYLFHEPLAREQLDRIARRVLANGVIESVHFDAYVPRQFERGRAYTLDLRHVPLRELSDEQLATLSREGHLFLSPAEMRAIQGHYRELGREPTDVELETLAQTWSEHCVHKTLKSAVEVEVRDSAGEVVATRHYENLIKETIFKSTMDLTNGGQDASFCLSVFADNAGVIAFDEKDAVCFKVETHNHPSAIEPYGGSATGIGGVIRDVLGTGLGAKPVANTDVFCVADPNYARPHPLLNSSTPNSSIANRKSQIANLPKGVIHPKRVLQQIVAGVRDYGNRMGIPTVNGAVYFDNHYLGNPLVFCGCVGLIPRDKIRKEARDGDAVVVMGGRTGRDGIHGATFSSAELTDTHADEFSHAVQIGNAITEKKVADVILQARDRGLFTAITDCGAGGLSSAVGEMAEKIGAAVELEKVPLKYAGLRYDEIWISEAQERMVLSVPQRHVAALLALARGEDVEATVIGRFGCTAVADPRGEIAAPLLLLTYRGQEVGRMAMDFLHHGIPKPRRKAVVYEGGAAGGGTGTSTGFPPLNLAGADWGPRLKARLLACLAHPNIASKHWVIRQYDHEVQGGSVIKPLIGPRQVGPSDAAVVRPKLGSWRGIALGCGLAPHVADPYRMALAAIDEAIRNVVAVGADPARVALLDNFCWPSVEDEFTMGTLVRACEACYDAAMEYGTPFISGKDSLHNQFTHGETGEVIRIPNTLLISAIGVLDDVRRCVTMDLKSPGNHLGILRQADAQPELAELAAAHRHMARAIRAGLVVSCHDVSDGGALVAAAEMCLAGGVGLHWRYPEAYAFRETPGCYLVEFRPEDADALRDRFESLRLTFDVCGTLHEGPSLTIATPRQPAGQLLAEATIEELTAAWRGTLDW